jgi:hypothetical protein
MIRVVIAGRSSVRCSDQSGEALHFRSRGQFSITMLVQTRRSSFHGRKSARRSSMLRGEVPGAHISLRWKRLGSTFLRGTDLRAGVQ